MKKILENDYIDVSGTEFLTIINRKAEAQEYFPVLKDEINQIYKTKKVSLEDIQELFTFLVYSDDNYKHYYKGLKTLISDGMCPTCAIEIMENDIEENEKMFSFLENYIEYEFTIDGMVKIYWREDYEWFSYE